MSEFNAVFRFSLELLKSTMEKVMADMEEMMNEIVELLKPKVRSDLLVLFISPFLVSQKITGL